MKIIHRKCYYSGMTPKQREAARLYAQGASIIEACKGAGYSDKYSKKMGHNLFKRDEIRNEVQRVRARLNERAEKSATDVVNEYAKIAFTDRVSFLKEDPHIPGEFIYKSPDELDEDQRAIVEKVTFNTQEVRVVNQETREVETIFRQEYNYILSDKANALQQMGRHFGIFDDKLRLVQSQQNPFKNASPEQLAELKKSFIGIMSGEAIDGEYEEVKNMLPDDQGRTGTGS